LSDSIEEFHVVGKQVCSAAEVVDNVVDVNQEKDGANVNAVINTVV